MAKEPLLDNWVDSELGVRYVRCRFTTKRLEKLFDVWRSGGHKKAYPCNYECFLILL